VFGPPASPWWHRAGRHRYRRPPSLPVKIQPEAHLKGLAFLDVPLCRAAHAVTLTRLSCHRFAANTVRLQLHALAYNLANFLRTLGCRRR
jgi:hypothetical protein